MKLEKLKLNIKNFPILCEVEINENIKRYYVIRRNKEKTGIFLNRIEQY